MNPSTKTPVPGGLKKVLKPFLNIFLHYGPSGMVLSFARRGPRWYLLPAGRTFRYNRYLGDLSVFADPIYPIEREMLTGEYDAPTQAVINQFVKPGHVCLDVGANVGAITLAIAKKAGASGKVFSFEPGIPTFRRLQTNVGLNPRFEDSVVPIQLGLSDVPGKLFWEEDPNNRGNAGLSANTGIPVDVTTVDDYFATRPLTRLDFVKIDVEGMEYEVLKGGLQTWSKFHPTLYFETMREFETARNRPLFQEIEMLLKTIGYRLYKTADGRIIQTTSADVTYNTLALHESFCP